MNEPRPGTHPVTTADRGAVFDKIRTSNSDGRMLVVWDAQECEALKDLLDRLHRLEGEVVDGEQGLARMLEQAYDN